MVETGSRMGGMLSTFAFPFSSHSLSNFKPTIHTQPIPLRFRTSRGDRQIIYNERPTNVLKHSASNAFNRRSCQNIRTSTPVSLIVCVCVFAKLVEAINTYAASSVKVHNIQTNSIATSFGYLLNTTRIDSLSRSIREYSHVNINQHRIIQLIQFGRARRSNIPDTHSPNNRMHKHISANRGRLQYAPSIKSNRSGCGLICPLILISIQSASIIMIIIRVILCHSCHYS